MLALMKVIMVWYDNICSRSDIDVTDTRVVFNEGGVPETRLNSDSGRLHAAQTIDDTLELDAFGCLLLTILEDI